MICNLQRTPLTEQAHFQIYAPTDTVMQMLMQQLGLHIPSFKLQRRVVLGTRGGRVFVKAIEPHDAGIEVQTICQVQWAPGKQLGGLSSAVNEVNVQALCPTLHFMGHYHEPAFRLPTVDLSTQDAVECMLSFEPHSCSWSCSAMRPFPLRQLSPVRAADNRYGQNNQQYCVDGVVKLKGCSRQDAQVVVYDRFKSRRDQAKLAMKRRVIELKDAGRREEALELLRHLQQLQLAAQAGKHKQRRQSDVPVKKESPHDDVLLHLQQQAQREQEVEPVCLEQADMEDHTLLNELRRLGWGPEAA